MLFGKCQCRNLCQQYKNPEHWLQNRNKFLARFSLRCKGMAHKKLAIQLLTFLLKTRHFSAEPKVFNVKNSRMRQNRKFCLVSVKAEAEATAASLGLAALPTPTLAIQTNAQAQLRRSCLLDWQNICNIDRFWTYFDGLFCFVFGPFQINFSIFVLSFHMAVVCLLSERNGCTQTTWLRFTTDSICRGACNRETIQYYKASDVTVVKIR